MERGLRNVIGVNHDGRRVISGPRAARKFRTKGTCPHCYVLTRLGFSCCASLPSSSFQGFLLFRHIYNVRNRPAGDAIVTTRDSREEQVSGRLPSWQAFFGRA